MKTSFNLKLLIAAFTLLFFATGQNANAQNPCVAAFQYMTNAGTTSVSFFDSSTVFSGNIVSWIWDFGDNGSSTTQNPVHTYNSPGTYLVCLTIVSANPACTSVYCDTISVGGAGSCNASFNYSQNLPQPIISFTNQSTGTYTYQYWTFGDGSNSTSANPVHTYGNPGTYLVCLTIGDSATNCFDTYCQNITVTGSATCSANFFANVGGGGSVLFTASSGGSGTPVSWFWNFGDGGSGTGQAPTYTYSAPGTYLVCLILTTSNPQCVVTYCDSVIVTTGSGGTCTANFTYTQNTSQPFLNFTNTSTGNFITSVWDFGDGTTSTQTNPIHTYQNPGWYMVCLTIGNPAIGCTSTYCDSVQVLAASNCQAAFSVNADSTNFNFTFGNNSTGTNLTYFWSFGDGSTSTMQNPQHSYSSSGIYGVCLTVSNSNCVSTACDTVYVGSTSSCSAYYTWNQNAGTIAINFTSYSAGAQLSYLWDFGDGSTSTQQNPIHIFANAGTYTVCLTISDSQTGCTDTYCSVVTIQTGGGNCSSNYAIYPDTTAAHSYIAYNLATGIAPLTYLWSWGDSTFSNTAYPSHTYAGPGLYDICLTITDAVGCSSTTCYQWSLLRLSGGVPVTINVVQGTTGINEAESTGSLNVYPNPASGMLNIDLANPTGKPASIELYNLQGQRTMDLGTINEPSATLNVDLNNTPAGIYILKVSAGNWLEHHKVVVK